MGTSLNYEVLLSHLSDDEELAQEILMVFLNDGPERVKSFSEAAKDRDQTLMIKFSHSLKGISATIRAERLSMLAEKTEKLCRENKLEDGADLLPELESELELVVNEIKEITS